MTASDMDRSDMTASDTTASDTTASDMTVSEGAGGTRRGRLQLRPPTGRRIAMILALTALWCGLWREISTANVAVGLVLATAVLASGVGTPTYGAIRIGPSLRLIGLVIVDLVTSTIDVAREVLVPADTTNEAIIAVEVDAGARNHLLLLVIAVTLTPGTAVVDADPDTGTLYLHLLHAERRDDAVRHVKRLSELAGQALPSPDRSSTSTVSSQGAD